MPETMLRSRWGGLIPGLLLAVILPSRLLAAAERVTCEGRYPHHLQGICLDDAAIYWCFTTQLVKTDLRGKIVKQIPVANHHGDLCLCEGKVCVAVNLGEFNEPAGKADSWIYIYRAADLTLLAKHATPEVVHGAGGIGMRNGRFYVVGGLPEGVTENYVYEYDQEFRFQKRHVIASGHTDLGIQTATFAEGRWYFGCYGKPEVLLVIDADFRLIRRTEFNCSYGIAARPEGGLVAADNLRLPNKEHEGVVFDVIPDAEHGLKRPD
ncbi:MAG: hypothetical protein ACK6D3_08350 [Planctomycetaceae bacterium]